VFGDDLRATGRQGLAWEWRMKNLIPEKSIGSANVSDLWRTKKLEGKKTEANSRKGGGKNCGPDAMVERFKNRLVTRSILSGLALNPYLER